MNRRIVAAVLDEYLVIGDSLTAKETLRCTGMALDPEEIFALRKDSGWYCQVPQCGAVYDLDGPFAMKLHLRAHGSAGGVTTQAFYQSIEARPSI